jgi:hypothetical protein
LGVWVLENMAISISGEMNILGFLAASSLLCCVCIGKYTRGV